MNYPYANLRVIERSGTFVVLIVETQYIKIMAIYPFISMLMMIEMVCDGDV